MKKTFALILSLIILLCALPLTAFAREEVTRVLACSDFQHADDNEGGAAVTSAIADAIKADGKDSFDGFICCGDYDRDLTMLPGPTGSGVDALSESVNGIVNDDAQRIFVQGNHDSLVGTAGLTASGPNDPDSGKYGVFVINEDDYAWFGGNRHVTKCTADDLRQYLNVKLSENFTAPIFVVSHLPLHYTYRGRLIHDGRYAKYIFDVLNEAGAKGLNIIFLFGHNHSNGWDDYLGASAICLEKGDGIIIPALGNNYKWNEYTLNFTYINAGYVGYYRSFNNADDTLTMTVYEIYSDKVVISRYSEDGLYNMKSEGVRNKAVLEYSYDPNTEIKPSPVTVKLGEITDNTPISGGINAFDALVMRLYRCIFGRLADIANAF